MNKKVLLENIDKIHTTKMGVERVSKNLNISCNIVEYIKNKILDSKCYIYKNGKNWYCENGNIQITINASTYTIITAHLS